MKVLYHHDRIFRRTFFEIEGKGAFMKDETGLYEIEMSGVGCFPWEAKSLDTNSTTVIEILREIEAFLKVNPK